MGWHADMEQRQGRAARHFVLRDQPVACRGPATAAPRGDDSLALLDDSFDQDERILNNFDRMIKTSKKRDVKKLWKIKKAEHLRNMRWKTLGGMEKTSYGQDYHPETYS